MDGHSGRQFIAVGVVRRRMCGCARTDACGSVTAAAHPHTWNSGAGCSWLWAVQADRVCSLHSAHRLMLASTLSDLANRSNVCQLLPVSPHLDRRHDGDVCQRPPSGHGRRPSASEPRDRRRWGWWRRHSACNRRALGTSSRLGHSSAPTQLGGASVQRSAAPQPLFHFHHYGVQRQ